MLYYFDNLNIKWNEVIVYATIKIMEKSTQCSGINSMLTPYKLLMIH